MRCGPRILRSMGIDEMLMEYARLYREGRHGEGPDAHVYDYLRERGKLWVLASIPLRMLDYQRENESSQGRIERALAYSQRGGVFPPGVAKYRHVLRRRRAGVAFVQDGNHRTLAAEMRGDCAIAMFMPRSEYMALVEDARYRGLVEGR